MMKIKQNIPEQLNFCTTSSELQNECAHKKGKKKSTGVRSEFLADLGKKD